MTGLKEGDEIVLYCMRAGKWRFSDGDGIKVPSLITITLAVKRHLEGEN